MLAETSVHRELGGATTSYAGIARVLGLPPLQAAFPTSSSPRMPSPTSRSAVPTYMNHMWWTRYAWAAARFVTSWPRPRSTRPDAGQCVRAWPAMRPSPRRLRRRVEGSRAHTRTVVYDYQTFTLQRFGGISRYVCEVAARVHRAPGFRARDRRTDSLQRVSLRRGAELRADLHLPHPRLEPLNRRVCRALSPWAVRAAKPPPVHRTNRHLQRGRCPGAGAGQRADAEVRGHGVGRGGRCFGQRHSGHP